jgi:nicotinate-nucleotide adenylyltransferase
MAHQVREKLGLASVVFVPTGQPVHRRTAQASSEDRFKMIELAIADNSAFGVSRYEIDRTERSYMADTLAAFHASDPQRRLVLIVSTETVALMPSTWRHLDRVFELTDMIAVVPRLGHPDNDINWVMESFPGRANHFQSIWTSQLGNSSTNIRRRVAAGLSIRYLVPPAVEAYIGEHHLYVA